MSDFFEFDEHNHQYYINGEQFTSVTQVLDKAGFVPEFCKAIESRMRGTAVHQYCAEDDVKRVDLRTVQPDLRGYIRAWRIFRSQTGFLPELIEHRVYSKEWGYAGTLDRTGYLYGLEIIIDIKTSTTGAASNAARLQTAAYGYALNPKKLYNRAVVALKSDAKYNIVFYEMREYRADVAEFLELVRKQNGEKR